MASSKPSLYRRARRLARLGFEFLTRHVWFLRPIYETRESHAPILLRMVFFQKILGFNRRVPWPVHFTSRVTGWEHIHIGIAAAPGFMGGCYVFAREDSPIYVGDYTICSVNVCLAGYSHDPCDTRKMVSKGGIKIGSYCWLSANCSVMPGVELGDHTVVAAGAVVTQSFPEGHCILGGVPAKVIKRLDPAECVKFSDPIPYIGYRKVSH
ncbi:acyltransferase [Parachitinimonas caeni]|uniref:Acyltransferase n=1 Tax=Parachitinimonas caeni TaxID=3031301 RepID=A0ABT7DS42_9NEIS|nr:acyltransferase [Parachitinimonas caeni]MDK2122884.1 acyltransferase [Parachitinimonas caeni]